MRLSTLQTRIIVLLTEAALASPVYAQSAAPVTVTPPTLRPEHDDHGFKVDIPEAGGLTAPAGAEGMSVTLAGATLEGGFPEVATESAAILAKLRGQRVTLAQIYAAASEIEAAHARAGYVLARVAVPPQDLRDGGALRITVIDGFIEAVDTTGVPARVRAVVDARTKKLIGQHHLRLGDIEQPLLIANEVPGLAIRSTLMRGSQPGTAKLVLDGTHKLVSGSIGVDNQLDPSLGRWGVNAQLSINSALGFGEQIYGFASSGYDISKFFESDVPVRVVGGGMVIPFGDGRFTLNPEVTFSRTQPTPSNAAAPTLGTLRRLSLRAGYTVKRTRAQTIVLNGTIEQIDERTNVVSFVTPVNHDRYMAARLGLNLEFDRQNGTSYDFTMLLSKGLGDTGGISQAEAQATTLNGFSRQGASNDFTKLQAQARGAWAIGKDMGFTLSAKGQSSFGKPLLRAEQFSLEGGDGASAYVGGTTSVDEGIVARAELSKRFTTGDEKSGISLIPYIFAAGGAGTINQPTALEPGSIKAASLGVGARGRLAALKLSFSLEYAHGLSDYATIDNSDRVNAVATFRF
jgi:hemolysin activation/secretion protein